MKDTIGYIVYLFGIYCVISWLYYIRTKTKSGECVIMPTVNTLMLFIVSLILVPALKISPLHIFWMFPASILLGLLSVSFPFSLITIFGNVVASIACIGLNQIEVQKNRDRVKERDSNEPDNIPN